MADHNLDTRGLLCPMPVIKTQNAIRKLQAGDVLTVTATDPGVLHDIPAWCRINGHKVLEQKQENREIEIRIEVCES
ncbi:MAG: sulfurtransferase TusA family protein [Gammaproteobacteria bacterium]|nr:sulfurtransferase TusA family protein [Gammaproteobacteria bacterium]